MVVYQPVAARHRVCLGNSRLAGGQPAAAGLYLWPSGQPTTAAQANTGANAAAGAASSPANSDIPPQTEPPTSANLTWLNAFYAAEQKRKTPFPDQLPADAQPFDLLVINICSLSWSDIEAAGLMDHPLWKHFDIVFKNFNSATSYSGPAAVRLLRASCGQLWCLICISRPAPTATCLKTWQSSASTSS